MLFLGFICDEQYYDELVAYGDFPLWCLTAPPSPRCEACHTILRSLRSPTNRVPLPPRCAVGLWMLDNVPYSSIEKSR